MIARTLGGPDGRLARPDEDRVLPTSEIPGRALATRRATTDIVRAAVLGSYGVAGFQAGVAERLLAELVGRAPGIHVSITGGRLAIHLHLRVGTGLPVAEVARQVDSAVRYAVRRALGREIDELRIRVGGLEAPSGSVPPPPPPPRAPGSSDLADSGTDVA
jgi:uncharacterized alkaline shock family protein YloU